MEVGVTSSYAPEPGYNTSLTYCHAELRDRVLREVLEIPFRVREDLVHMSAPTQYRVRRFSWFLSVSNVNSVM